MTSTGHFAINHTGAPFATVGSAELRLGFFGEMGAQLTILAGDFEEYDTYWLHVDLVERRLEYLYSMIEVEPTIHRAHVWPLDDEDLDEGAWQPGADDQSLLHAFTEMVGVADTLAIRPLALGMEIHQLGGPIDEELLEWYRPLWQPI